MGHRDLSCPVHNRHVDRLHDSLHTSLRPSLQAPVCREVADVSRTEAVEEIIGVFCRAQTHAFGLNREQLVEAFRSMFVDAEARKIEYLMLALLQPERHAYLVEQLSDWARGHARAVANGEVRV